MRAFRFPDLLFAAILGLATACLSTEPDNLPPIVTITQPENGHVVDVGEVVEIVVDASDSDGVVASVAFYVDGVLLGRDYEHPFAQRWDTGDQEGYYHQVSAVAEDDDTGQAAHSATVYTSWTYEIPEQVDDGWQTASLESVGMDAERLMDLMNFLRDEDEHLVHGILIVKDGSLVLEQYFDGLGHPTWGESPTSFDRETVHGLSSVTKSVTATLFGIAVDRGFIPSVDTPVFDYFPELASLNVGQKVDITLEHLVTMSSGLEWDEWSYSLRDERNDLIRFINSWDPMRFVLERQMVATPGELFTYSGGSTNVLGEAVGRASGRRLDEFSDEYLFALLGIEDYSWLVLRRDYEFVYASGDLRMRPRDMLKLGLLYLQRGIWNGEQILSDEWVDASAEPYQHLQGWDAHSMYSYGWWPQGERYGEGAFAASGWGQQTIIVLPEIDMVAVFTGGSYWTAPALTWHDMMVSFVLPAVQAGSSSSATFPTNKNTY